MLLSDAIVFDVSVGSNNKKKKMQFISPPTMLLPSTPMGFCFSFLDSKSG